MRFKNFSIWRGRLPHWRADDVRYYVTFRHRRELTEHERLLLFRSVLRVEGKKLQVLVLCVLPEATEMICTMREDQSGAPFELSDVVEKAKGKAGREIIKSSNERFAPFYGESYDRIIRDDEELEGTWRRIIQSPLDAALAVDEHEYETLFVAHAGDI